MEQSSLKLQYKVGLFISAGLVIFMVSILLLGADKALFTSYVEVRTRFSDVQGLFPGSVVSLAGVPVGNVEELGFVPSENKIEITMKINEKFHDRLVEGTVAEVRTQGALGDKYIYLAPGKPGSPRLSENSVIEGIDSDLMKMLTDREDGVARVIDLIKELHILVATVNNGGQTATMMKNMSEASVKLNSTLKTIDSLLGDLHGDLPQNKKLKQAIVSLSNIMEKIDQGKGSLGQLINDPTVHQSLKAFLGGSSRSRYMKDMIRETIQGAETAR